VVNIVDVSMVMGRRDKQVPLSERAMAERLLSLSAFSKNLERKGGSNEEGRWDQG
jgi:hypothetical protein